jgi:hypothetical protein
MLVRTLRGTTAYRRYRPTTPRASIGILRPLTGTVHFRKQTLVWYHPDSTSEVIIA